MKAVLIEKPGTLQIVERPMPQITMNTQVLVKVTAAGICGSDVHILHGTHAYATYPRIIGHEGCGVIVETGSAVKNLRTGDAVIIEPIYGCGKCYSCRHGHYNCCPDIVVAGVHTDGVFEEYLVVDYRQLHQYDHQKLSPVEAATAEPYTVGAQAISQAQLTSGDLVLIHGAGPIGLIICDMAQSSGATVIVSEVNETRLQIAQAFGATYTINPAKDNLAERIREISKQASDGNGVNVVFETSGVPALTTQSIELLSPHGRFVPLTFAPEPMPINFRLVNKNELVIAGTRNQCKKFHDVVAALPARKARINKLVTHVFALADAQQAFDVLHDKTSGACKVVLTF